MFVFKWKYGNSWAVTIWACIIVTAIDTLVMLTDN